MSPNRGVFGTVRFCGSVEQGFWNNQQVSPHWGLLSIMENQARWIARDLPKAAVSVSSVTELVDPTGLLCA